MHQLTNVPTEASLCRIEASVNGETIEIRCVEKRGDRPGIGMSSLYVGDHMLSKPEALRQMIGDAICLAIRAGRDAGYHQAKAEIRAALGIERS
jgi:hypothetical protein